MDFVSTVSSDLRALYIWYGTMRLVVFLFAIAHTNDQAVCQGTTMLPPTEVTTRTAVICATADGIIRITHTMSIETLADAHANVAMIQQLSRAQPALLLIDSRALTQMSLDVRTYYTSATLTPSSGRWLSSSNRR